MCNWSSLNFLQVNPKTTWSELCVSDNSTKTMDTMFPQDVRNESVVIPFCNDTQSVYPPGYGRGSLHPIWQGNPIP